MSHEVDSGTCANKFGVEACRADGWSANIVVGGTAHASEMHRAADCYTATPPPIYIWSKESRAENQSDVCLPLIGFALDLRAGCAMAAFARCLDGDS